MARRNQDSPIAELAALVFIGIGFSVYNRIKELTEEYSWLTPVVIAVAILLIVLYAWWRIRSLINKRRAVKAFKIADIDNMDGVTFEYYLAKVLKSRGYSNVKVTEKYDMGVDIVAEKDGIKWGIQAKRYKSKVKADAVRQVYTALTHYGCDRSMVVTNSYYTRPARQLAAENKCVLIGRDELMSWILEYNQS